MQGIPFFHNVPGVGHNVEGEIYAIDQTRLEHLDVFESYPDFFTRREEVIELVKDDDLTEEAKAILGVRISTCALVWSEGCAIVLPHTFMSGLISNASFISLIYCAFKTGCKVVHVHSRFTKKGRKKSAKLRTRHVASFVSGCE